ncbi:DUF4082 domain-containing protein [Bacillus thuringiensis]|uniref:DUF4082 domain-containing protein n=1 Tax=Bacillus thuringiensis TaxID=1428 RepID=UPI00366EF4DD
MTYLWEPLTKTGDFSGGRGSMFQVKKEFSISELLLGTPQPDKWETGEIWEIDANNKFVSQLYKGSTLSRLDECYVPLSSAIKLTANKRYSIIFRVKAKDVTALCYAVSGNVVLAVPTESDLFAAVTEGDDRNNFAGTPAPGNSAVGNSYKIQVGFTIAKPKRETYFEMCGSPITNWSNAKHTVANQIVLQQDVKVVAMEFYTHPKTTATTESGTAKIWDLSDTLIAKGNPSPVSAIGKWTRSTFSSPVALEKDRTYYIGFSALGIGCAENVGTRTISSSDGSLAMIIANEGWSTDGPQEVDTRPEKKCPWQFSIRMYVEVDGTTFLIDSDGTIKKLSGSWTDIGLAPVTDQMFKEHGMKSLNDITAKQWRALPKNSKILVYSEEDKVFKASISRSNLYNSEEKLYRGTGIIETEMEELPAYRKTLMITADHQECTFQYSLDNGSTWNAFQSGDVIDVSKQSGKQLKIRINLPTDSAILTAISYAWA